MERAKSDERLSLAEARELLARSWRVALAGLLVGGIGALALLWRSAPVYRASATLLLEQDRSEGLLGDLVALSSVPIAESEMAILRSRTVAESVVRAPRAGELGLGLTALVDDERHRPLERLVRALSPWRERPEPAPVGLTVAVEGEGPRAEEELRVRFPGSERVAIEELALLGGEREERAFDGRCRTALAGFELRLDAPQPPEGRSFRVRLLPWADAVERVMRATRVSETRRGSGVIELSYDDSDPERAARVANALCESYLERNHERSERRASQTVDFIETQLEEQRRALEEAEAEVARLKSESPQFVDVQESARGWIEALADLEVQRMQNRILRSGLGEALALLDAGRFEALARLGPELADPMTTTYLASIAELTAQAELAERGDGGPYRSLLQASVEELRALARSLALEREALAEAARGLERGDAAALGRLARAGEPGREDPVLVLYLEQWTRVDARLRELGASFTGELPEIGRLEGERDALSARLLEILRGRVEGLAAQEGRVRAQVAEGEARLAAYPAEERGALQAAIDGLEERTHRQLESRLAGLEEAEAALARERAAIETDLGRLPVEERRLAEPLRRVAAHGEVVRLLLARLQEAQISRAATVATAEFLDRAVPPTRPRGPSLLVHLLMGPLLGLGAAAGFVLLRETVDRTVFTVAELEEASRLPVLGTIPDYRRGPGRARGRRSEPFLALREDPDCPAAEAYRALRASLEFSLADGDMRTLAVTSSGPGEGKSVTNVDLAMAFALAGRRVLLVDADLRRGSVAKYLGMPAGPGLAEVLQGSASWREAVLAGPQPGLDVLVAGRRPASPGDLLASEGARSLFAELRDAYDLVVFDVPPALSVADVECLARRIDAFLVLCRSSRPTREVVSRTVGKLKGAGARVLGAVLNGASANLTGKKYGYGYGYGYGDAA